MPFYTFVLAALEMSCRLNTGRSKCGRVVVWLGHLEIHGTRAAVGKFIGDIILLVAVVKGMTWMHNTGCLSIHKVKIRLSCE